MKHIKFSGIFRFGIQSEPFLDERLLDIINMMRIKVPRARITCETNGTLIDKEKVVKFFKRDGNLLRINVYNERLMQKFIDLSSEVRDVVNRLVVNDSSVQSSYARIRKSDKILQVEDNFSEHAFNTLISAR